MKPWLLLSVAIIAEVFGTSFLKSSQGLTRPYPVLAVVFGYGISFYFLSLTLEAIPVGIAYAVWSGVGLVLVTLVGWLVYDQILDWPAIIGVGMILTGVLVLNVFSSVATH